MAKKGTVSEQLSPRIHELLLRAAPEAVGSVTDVVKHALDEGLSDPEVINMLCAKYNVGPEGWPLDPERRKMTRLNRFIENNGIQDELKREHLLRQAAVRNEATMLDELYKEYGRDELGRPLDPRQFVRDRLEYVLRRCAPDHVGRLHAFMDEYARRGVGAKPHEFVDEICSRFGVQRDGWPGHPTARRRARLTRFFATNNPGDLRKVEALMNVPTDEADVMAELFAMYGKNEVGDPVRATAQLRSKLSEILSLAAPDRLPAINSIVAYGERQGLSDARIVSLICDELAVAEDGWPSDPRERMRRRLETFFMTNAPTEMHKVDRLMSLGNAQADEIMRQLYSKYGVNEFGKPVVDDAAVDADLEDRIAEFYEERVGAEDVLALTKQALDYNLPSDTLFALLHERYQGVKAVPNELRRRLRLIFRRVGEPDPDTQVRRVMALKRKEELSDDDVVAAVSERFSVRPDGWPEDTSHRVRMRLQLFFRHNDAVRLRQVDELSREVGDDTKKEKALFTRLAAEYGGATEFGPHESAVDDDGTATRRSVTTPRGSFQDSAPGSRNDGEATESVADSRGFEPTYDGRDRPFMPGMTQVWPPPDINTSESLYRSAFFEGLVKKYGGSSVDFSAPVEDPFARLARQFDDPLDSTWTVQPPIEAPRRADQASVRRQNTAVRPPPPPSMAEEDAYRKVKLGSFACNTLQRGALPLEENVVRKHATAPAETLDACRNDRRKQAAAQRLTTQELRGGWGRLDFAERELGPASQASAAPQHAPRGKYSVAIPDGFLPTPHDIDRARVAKAAAAGAERALPARLAARDDPLWVADEQRHDAMYPLASCSWPAVDRHPGIGQRPQNRTSGLSL